MSHHAACNLWRADSERGARERTQHLNLELRERERRESTKTTINNYASIAIAEGDAAFACGWRAEN